MKPIIGIIGYIAKFDEKTYITLDESLRQSIVLSGGLPILVLPTQKIKYDRTISTSKTEKLTEEEKKDLERQIDMCDGIIFQGGVAWYEFHEYAFSYALKKNKSILGMCLGMQVMAAAVAKKHNIEYKNIENNTEIDHANIPSNEYCHEIILDKNSKLYSIIGQEKFKVNSRHTLHIGETREFKITAHATDNIPEAIEYPNKKFVIGLQWHPEKMIETDEISKKIFNAFINSCIE